jgi:hypothetical protein
MVVFYSDNRRFDGLRYNRRFDGPGTIAGSMVSGTIAGPMVSGTIAGPMFSGTIAGPMVSGTIAGAILVEGSARVVLRPRRCRQCRPASYSQQSKSGDNEQIWVSARPGTKRKLLQFTSDNYRQGRIYSLV